jgi:hypothetical protein
MEKRVGKGAVLMFAGPLDLRASDLPLRALFVPLLRESLRVLLSHGDASRAVALGESLTVPAGGSVALPDGSTQKAGEKDALSITLAQTGIYAVSKDGQTERYAANADAKESDLAPVPAEDLEKMIAYVPDVQVRTNAGHLERIMQADERAAAEQHLSLGWWALMAVFLMVPLELYVAQKASKK